MHVERDILLRIGRQIFWRSPALYRPIGWLRNRTPYRLTNYDAWVAGFPRSSNTYTGKALQLHLPGARVIAQVHLPPPIIQALRDGKPGIFVIRRPEDAVVSWTQYSSFSLEHCVHYYIDFHRILRPYRHELLVARFEETTCDFPAVLRRFNARYGLNLAHADIDEETIFRAIDDNWRMVDGSVHEMQVARPSATRRAQQGSLWDQLDSSAHLKNQFKRARELYEDYAATIPIKADPELDVMLEHRPGGEPTAMA